MIITNNRGRSRGLCEANLEDLGFNFCHVWLQVAGQLLKSAGLFPAASLAIDQGPKWPNTAREH